MTSPAGRPRESTRAAPRFAAIAALLFVPVAAIAGGNGGYTFVMPWGFFNPSSGIDGSWHAYPIWRFFLDHPGTIELLPESIWAWPVALACHVLAAASAASGAAFGREDRRVTAGLLFLAGAASLRVAIGIASRTGVEYAASLSALPVGAVAAWTVAVAVYARRGRAR